MFPVNHTIRIKPYRFGVELQIGTKKRKLFDIQQKISNKDAGARKKPTLF